MNGKGEDGHEEENLEEKLRSAELTVGDLRRAAFHKYSDSKSNRRFLDSLLIQLFHTMEAKYPGRTINVRGRCYRVVEDQKNQTNVDFLTDAPKN